MTKVDDGLRVRGAFRLALEEGGEIIGDSGWFDNTVTNDGKLGFLVRTLGAIANSSQVSYVGVGTGTAPNATHTVLDGELTDATNTRKAVSASTVAGSTSVAFYATFASTDSHITAAHNISNIGLFATPLAAGPATQGTLFAGNTYTSSSWATNQNLNITYQVNFS